MNSQNNNSEKRKREKSSWVWDFFNFDKENDLVQCKKCDFKKTHNNSTTYLRNHLAHHGIYKKISQQQHAVEEIFSQSESEFSDDELSAANQPTKKQKLSAGKIESINEKLVDLMIISNQPSSLVESKVFKKFCHELNPYYQPPTRSTFNNNFLPERVI